MRKITIAAVALLGSVALAGATTLPAFAADTTSTVAVTAGGLSITAPATLAFSAAAPNAISTAALVGVQVSDLRAATGGWVSNVILADFVFTGTTGPIPIPASIVTYTAGTPAVTGTATVTPAAAVSPNAESPVQTATAVTGNNTATWDAALSMTVPSAALFGTYSAVLTHSVA
ncbi:hypothetical protein E3O44_03065 [Cryobacterium algoricola]|uniref:WxL domain-containing protein n=1 Tax=Cryobacterium algoricola TaxID=1259183 RepID=A0ABY2IGA9_9MICO|nr:hypothetical protein [Cryobacterium algoricola]TFB90590.1 hypothetical protein E3O44_03065 [Cryobacterium algoricola]